VSLTLTWGSVTGAATYGVQVATDSLFATLVVNDSGLTIASQPVSSLLNSTKYYWRVNAKNAAGTSSYSATSNFTTIVAVPAVPVLQTPASGAIDQAVSLTLTWGSVTGAATYRVQVATDSLFAALVVNDSTLTTASKSVSSLLNSTKYYWRVNAKNTAGTSSYSTVFNFTTVAAAGPTISTIAEARKDLNGDYIADHVAIGDTLTLVGIITTPNMGLSATQTSYYIQDATGGIDVFAYGLSATTYAIGDSVMVTGKIAQYKGLVELTLLALDDAHFTILKHNATVPAPKLLTLNGFLTNAESYEGQLIELDTLYKKSGTWNPANKSIYLWKGTGTDSVQLFLDTDAGITATEFAYPINVVGFVSQYSSLTPPNNGYELCPRSTIDITTIVVVPTAPALLTPATGAIDQAVSLTLTWGSVTGAATYTVQVATDSLFATLVVNDSTLTTASKPVSSLLNSTTYYWRVNAKNTAGTSSYSTVFNFTTVAAAPVVPAVPVLQTPATGALDQPVSLTLTWGSVTGAATYRVQVSTDSLFTSVLVVNDSTLTTASKLAGPLQNDTKYYWRVNAKNAGGTSNYSTVFNFTTIVAVPSIPGLLTPANGAIDQPATLTLTWGSVTGAATYRVQVASDSLFSRITLNDSTLTTASKEVGPLPNNTKYYWRVNAKNVGGTSSYSTVFNFTTSTTGVEASEGVPTEFSLKQNYPNPFNPSTTIKFGLPTQASVTMEIYNMLGVKVRTLIQGEVMSAGIHQMEWNGKDNAGVSVTSGVYLYRINAGTFQVSKKMMLLK
jgi:hypothetical protein